MGGKLFPTRIHLTFHLERGNFTNKFDCFLHEAAHFNTKRKIRPSQTVNKKCQFVDMNFGKKKFLFGLKKTYRKIENRGRA